MKTRWPHLLALLALLPCLALAGTACGTDDKDEPTEDAATDTGDATDTADTAKDVVAPKDTAKPDIAAKDVGLPKDIAKPKKSCPSALNCLLSCSDATGPCADKCQSDLGAGVADKLKAIADCRSTECVDTKGDVAGVTCALDKCLAKFDDCLGLDAGAENCVDTAICVGGCVLGDLNCTINCLVGGEKGVAAKAGALKICADAKCGGSDAVAMPACVTDSCADDVKACATGTKYNCAQVSNCVAHCPPSKKIEPNHCGIYCRVYAEESALKILSDYEKCKDGCNLVSNPVGCVLDKCSKEQNACYTDVGIDNCQDVYECVVKDCQGVGGDPACIAKCTKKGSAAAQDAFLHWEGCVLNNIDRDEAITVGCAFPYDQVTCVNYVSANFCGNQASHCFTSN